MNKEGILFVFLCELCMDALPAFLSVYNLMFGVLRGQEKALYTLKLGLQMVLSLDMGTGNRTQMFWKSIQCS